MKTPYLIQRLKKPYQVENQMTKLSECFSFGGGLKNGGLTNEAMEIIRQIWRYDYMGSVEFEWGAVPKSLSHVVENISKYITGQIEVTGKCHDYNGEIKTLSKTKTVYYCCKAEDKEEVELWIQIMADELLPTINNKFPKRATFYPKECVNLAGNICNLQYHEDLAGWHDIQNHYLFFTDKTMFDNFCQVFIPKTEKA